MTASGIRPSAPGCTSSSRSPVPEITGRIVLGGPIEPCVWCGWGTDTRGNAPGLGDGVELPIHVFCSGAVIVAYRRWANGALLAGDREKLARYVAAVRRLSPGGT
jgi:hypothetical protein